MARTTPWTGTNGLALGIFAGAVFLVAEMIAAAAAGDSVLAPFRMFASILMGQRAFTSGLGAALVLGALFHFVFSALLGFIYSFLNARLSPEGRINYGLQAAVGSLFGLFIWLVDFQVFARAFYPWFLESGQFLQAVLHAFCFGLPLGLAFAYVERSRMARHARLGTGQRTEA